MRIGTWNILAGQPVEPGDHPSLETAVAALDLDVLGLNEVDFRWERSGFQEQARDAAAAMGAVDWRFGPSFAGLNDAREPRRGVLLGPDDRPVGAHYGIALLSRIPVRRWHRLELGQSPVGLPLLSARNGERTMRYVVDEPHLAIAAELDNDWTVIATHLSFVTPVAIAQLMRVRGWARRFGRRAVIIGDMNLARFVIPLRPRWRSVVNANTYPSWSPSVQLDHILIGDRVDARVLELAAPGISDHLPIAIEVD